MQFVDIKTDFAFKKIFGSEESKDILISFLNAMLDFGENPIVKLMIVNPYQLTLMRERKDSVIGIKATLANDIEVVIELQMINQLGLGRKPILSNITKATQHNNQAVIALMISDCVLLEFSALDTLVINKFKILQEKTSGYMELVFVELPKFNKTELQLSSITDKWIYFLKNVANLKYIPQILNDEDAIKQAFQIATHFSREELKIQSNYVKSITEQKNTNHKGKKGKILEVDDEKAAKLRLAKTMLETNSNVSFVMQVTGLDWSDIKSCQ
jgi:predicted transposase/invertase (TIGR01784 family)